MSKNTSEIKQNNTSEIASLSQLENVLGVKMSKTTKTTNKTLSEQQQVMKEVKKAMEELLFTKFPQYYKNIESDVIVTSKEGEHKLQRVSGNYLLFKQDVIVGNKTHKGYKICKPTTYVKGGNSFSCLYYKEIGKTSYNK